jgi:hypothetical protein
MSRATSLILAAGMLLGASLARGQESVFPIRAATGRESQAAQRALAHARRKYPAVFRRKVQIEAVPSGRDSRVIFWEILPENGGRSGNYLRLRVDARTGAVRFDGERQRPVPPDAYRPPGLVRELAVQRAARTVGMQRVLSVLRTDLAWTPREGGRGFGALTWNLTIDGLLPNCWAGTRSVILDAHDGRLLMVGPSGGANRREAPDGTCLLVAVSPLGVSRAVMALMMRPRTHQGRLWMPLDFAAIFGIRTGAPGNTETVRRLPPGPRLVRLPVARLLGTDYVPAAELLGAAGAAVQSWRADPRREALVVMVNRAGPMEFAAHYGMFDPGACGQAPDRGDRASAPTGRAGAAGSDPFLLIAYAGFGLLGLATARHLYRRRRDEASGPDRVDAGSG